jgi:rod shape-determining protein MreC
MAPSANRRSGFSRRAQYGTFFGYLAGVAGALVGAVLLILSVRNPDLFTTPRSLAAGMAEPAAEAGAGARQAGRGVFATLEGYVLAGTRYEAMRKQLAEAQADLIEAKAIKAENRRLKRLLGLAETGPEPVAITRLIGSSAASSRRIAIIPIGGNQGLTAGMPVRSSLGLVGRVLEVGPVSAKVLLLTDTTNLVPVRRVADDVAAFAQGRGDGTLVVRLIDMGTNPLKKGDILVTSGAGGLYRTGIPVAVVSALNRDGARARLLSDPGATDYVIVEPVSAVAAPPPSPEPAALPGRDAIPGSAGTFAPTAGAGP